MKFLRNKRKNPRGSSSSRTTHELAWEILDLQPFYNLHGIHDKFEAIGPLFPTETRIWYKEGASKYEQDRLMDRAIKKREEELLSSIQKSLDHAQKTLIFHFLCFVIPERGGDHGILISLIQNRSGRGLYIFDNMNEPIRRGSDSAQFIEFLCARYNVSKRTVFLGPELPHEWNLSNDNGWDFFYS